MSFLSQLFGKRTATNNKQGTTSFHEKDNVGTRHDSLSFAVDYWMARISSPKKDPFVMYTFDTAEDAEAALLELPCIHIAKDSQKLICREVLFFGYYPTAEGEYEAVIGGNDMTHELWEQAKVSFAKHGGRRKNDLEPEKQAVAVPIPKVAAGQPGKVVFAEEQRKQIEGTTMIYRVYKGPDAVAAKAFLELNPVTRRYYFIVVETPEGNYCRDIQGMYKE